MAITNYGSGNWFGLPEFGITELFGGKTSSVNNAMFRTSASQLPQTVTPTYSTPTNVNTGMASPTSSLVSPTASVDSTVKTANEPSEQDLLAQEYGFDSYDDYLKHVSNVESVYDDSYNYLDKLEESIKGGEQDFYNIYTSPYTSQIPTVQSNAQAGISNLNNQIGQAQYQQQDAYGAARGLFNELSARNRQAFGGVSSVGQAASEIGAREFQKQLGTITNTANQVIQGITTKINDVTREADSMVQQLQQQAAAAESQAKLAFQDKLMEIENMRNTINQQKAQLKLDALKEFRDRVQYLKDVATQRTYELENQRNAAISNLQAQAGEWSNYLGQQNQFAQQEVGQQSAIQNQGQESMYSANALGGQNANAQSMVNGLFSYSPQREKREDNIFSA
jgi:hypothetical protein